MKRRDTDTFEWDTYEAILDNVHFEYPSPFKDEPKAEVEKACRQYLDTFTNGYEMRDFYLVIKKKKK